MQEKDRYILFEFFLTLLLLLNPAYLLRDVLGWYWQYSAFLVIAGFGFSRFSGEQKGVMRLFMPVAALADLAWVIYLIFNSNFMYSEVVSIIVKGILVLSVILSFGAYSSALLGHIQGLSVALFMASLVFAKEYDNRVIALVLVYFIVWFMILKIKFYEMFQASGSREKMHYPIFLSLVSFVAVIFIAWFFFTSFPLVKFTNGGLFLEPSEHAEKSGITTDKEYYEVQDKIQDRIIGLLPSLPSQDEQHMVLAFLSSLMQESPYVMEVEKARRGLIDYLHRPGLGLGEKGKDELKSLINNYVDRKTGSNLRKNEGKLRDGLKKNTLSMQDKFQANSNINKMLRSDSSRQLDRHERQSAKGINNLSANRELKNRLNESLMKMAEWKNYELYNRKINDADKKISSLGEDSKWKLQDALSAIENAENLQDFKDASEKTQALEDKSILKNESAMKEIKEISNLKLGMLLRDKEEQLKKEIEDNKLFEYDAQRLKESLDELRTAEDKEVTEGTRKIREAAEESGLKGKDLDDFIEAKAGSSAQKKNEQIENLLDKTASMEARKRISEDFKKLQSEDDPEKIDSDAEALKEDLKRLSSEGLISDDFKERILKEAEEFEALIRAQADMPGKKDKTAYESEWERLINGPSLGAEKSQALKELTGKLLRANTLADFETVKKEIMHEIESLPREFEDAFKEFAKLKEAFIMEKALTGLREKVAEMEKTDPSGADLLEEDLRKIRDNRGNTDLAKELEKTKADFESRKSKMEMNQGKPSDSSRLQLYVMPRRVVIPPGSFVTLKVFAVYNDIFLKELNSGLEWFSSRPDTASVDAKGIVYSAAAGSADIRVRYKDTNKTVVITVVSGIDEKLSEEIKRDLKK